MGENKSQLPHLILNNTATKKRYTTPMTGGSGGQALPAREREKHATKLITQLEQLRPVEKKVIEDQKSFGIETNGIQVEFLSDPELNLKLESLEFQRSGIELCSTHVNSDKKTTATVFIPEGKIDHFLKKVIAYKDQKTKPNKGGIAKPRNQELIDSISEIKLAVLDSLWTDDKELLPECLGSSIWWEVWLRLSDKSDNIEFFKEHAERLGLRVNKKEIKFVDRAVVLAYGTKESMMCSISLLGIIAELRCAKVVGNFFTGMDTLGQREWVDDAERRITVLPEANVYACLLDTGINEAHPLLEPVADSADMHSYEPDWGTYDGYETGHGTPMAGLVVYGDLTEFLPSTDFIEIKYRLESVKILPNTNNGTNDPDLYGAITRESMSRVEIQPDRKRIFCMAVTADDHRGRGKPSSWSATVDSITSGAEDDEQRLMIISAGDTNPAHYLDYPESNQTDTVQDPGQAWNALVIGGYTEKIHITDPDYAAYEPLADSGDLSPSSCTSATWNTKNWPFKPDIVMEAGNVGVDRNINFASFIDDLELLSTHHDFQSKLLVNFRETSAATALATRLSAMLLAEYPSFWPETLRGLLVHSAEWTETMKRRFPLNNKDGYRSLLQSCGYGVPNPSKLFWSASNSLTLIAQDSLQPFFQDKGDIKTKDINLHEIPWPQEALEELGDTKIEMKVTLSYFIEPNPGQRGWGTKYRYASHRLQFDVRRSLETVEGFEQRINKSARDSEFDSKNNVKDMGWLLGSNLRKTGSIHSDTWMGTAAELAPRKYVAVYPLNGWWKELKKHERWANQARYSLIISITTPETDIYTEVASKIPSVIEV